MYLKHEIRDNNKKNLNDMYFDNMVVFNLLVFKVTLYIRHL